VTFEDQLYFFTGNRITGGEVWRSSNGVDWNQIGFGGWGNPNNDGTYWQNSIAVYKNGLYAGTIKINPNTSGGEIWLYLPAKSWLPLAITN
jgi:hypothetical protein